jgi:glycogen(starch) synthase
MIVVPSRWQEPFGLVALQGSQVGRPVVATRTGGLPEVIADGETGLIVEPDDPEALLRAMLKLAEDHELAVRLGSAGRRRALEYFTMSRCAEDYSRVYQEVVVGTSKIAGS